MEKREKLYRGKMAACPYCRIMVIFAGSPFYASNSLGLCSQGTNHILKLPATLFVIQEHVVAGTGRGE